jgi:hypothetical protein
VLHTLLSPANTHDSMLFEPLLETNPGVRRSPPPPGPTSPTAREAARRQGLRLPPLSPPPAPARDQGPHLPPRHRVGQPPRPSALGRRTHHLLLLRFKRLGLHYDRTQPTLRPLLTLAGVLINLRRLIQKELGAQVRDMSVEKVTI